MTDPRRDFTPDTDAQLDESARFTEQDIDECVAQWDRDGGTDSRGLLDAQPEGEENS